MGGTNYIIGASDNGKLQSTELIDSNGFVDAGPNLPTKIWGHSITSINKTVSFISGGETSASKYSPKTWYYNHESQLFRNGPSLQLGRGGHASATVIDSVTKSLIIVVAGGWNGNQLDSKELLIDDQWKPGEIMGWLLIINP